jgi:hypothetical protein
LVLIALVTLAQIIHTIKITIIAIVIIIIIRFIVDEQMLAQMITSQKLFLANIARKISVILKTKHKLNFQKIWQS